jgi:hypothetical protein
MPLRKPKRTRGAINYNIASDDDDDAGPDPDASDDDDDAGAYPDAVPDAGAGIDHDDSDDDVASDYYDDPDVGPDAPAYPDTGASASAGGGDEKKVRMPLNKKKAVETFVELANDMESISQASRAVMFCWLWTAIEGCLRRNRKLDTKEDLYQTLSLLGVFDSEERGNDYDRLGQKRGDIKPLRDQLWQHNDLLKTLDETNTSVSMTTNAKYLETEKYAVPGINPPLVAWNEDGQHINVKKMKYDVVYSLFSSRREPGTLSALNQHRLDVGFLELLHMARRLSIISTMGNLFPSNGPARTSGAWFEKAITDGMTQDKGPGMMTDELYKKFYPLVK